MNYENMSDFEINKAVAEIKFRDCIELEVFQNTYNGSAADVVSQGVHVTSFDFNNPSYAWPIIIENKIGGHWGKAAPGAYFAVSRLEEFVVMHKNPLRAAMIAYLMMQEAG